MLARPAVWDVWRRCIWNRYHWARTGSLAGLGKINDAIAGTDAGGTVNLLQGTYTENVTISKPLTLTGAGQANTTIFPAASGFGLWIPQIAGRQHDDSHRCRRCDRSELNRRRRQPGASGWCDVGGADVDRQTGIVTNFNAPDHLHPHDGEERDGQEYLPARH